MLDCCARNSLYPPNLKAEPQIKTQVLSARVMTIKPISASTAAPSLTPNPTVSPEPTSKPEIKQSLPITPIWIIAIAALLVVVIIELIFYFFLKARKAKS